MTAGPPRRAAGVLAAGLLAAAAVTAAAAAATAEAPPDAAGKDAAGKDAVAAAAVDRRAVARLADPPPGLPPVPLPAGVEPTPARVRLGRKLFLDRRLSVNGTLSCAMCHVPEQGFTSHELATAVGHQGESLPRNAPTLLNVAYAAPFFRDGREPDLDLQPFDVFLDPREMAMPSLGAVVERVRSLDDYRRPFENAFGGPPTVRTIGLALGLYLRTLLAADSPFDRWRYGGDESAVGAAAKRGFVLFRGEAGCASCHLVADDHALFTDNAFHDTGIAWQRAMVDSRSTDPVRVELAPGVFTHLDRSAVASVGEPQPVDTGRFAVTHDPAHRWQLKTPSLRNVAVTAPYMHDGSLATLRQVVEHYDRGGAPHDGLDPRITPLGLTDRQIDDLVALLESLTASNLDELIEDARSQRVGNFGDGVPGKGRTPGAAAGYEPDDD